VRNPILHLAGLGGNYKQSLNGVLRNQSDLHAVLDLSSGGTLSYIDGNSSFAVSSTQISTTTGSVSSTCTTNVVSGAFTTVGPAACGSVQVNGTVSAVTFTVSAIATQNANGGVVTSATMDGSGDGFGLTVTLPQDFGDAPASYNGTQAPAAIISDLTLGKLIDEDQANTRNPTTSSFPTAAANGDDISGATPDDEDAFTTLPTVLAGVANNYSLTVPVSGVSKTAYVCGYIDFDKGGTFDTSTERACATVAAGATSAVLTWAVPATTTAGNTYARFRLGYVQSEVQSPTGLSRAGEVEDYPITFALRPSIVLRKTTLGSAGGAFGFTLTNTTQTTGTVTTTAAGTAVQVDGDTSTAGTQAFTVAAINTAASIDETTIPSGWSLASATCTNASGTVIGSLSGSKYSLPSSEMTPGAAITCDFTNGPPSISLAKTAGPIVDNDGNGPDVGDSIVYSFVVKNNGQAPLTSVGVSDPKVGPVTCPVATLAVGASTTCTATYTLTQADVNAGTVVNTATASGTPPTGSAVTSVSSATSTITPSPKISLTKSAGAINDNDYNGPDAGDTVAYSFAVTNTGNVTLTGLVVNDPTIGPVTCPTTTLAPSATTTCTKIYTLTQSDVNAGTVNNSASVAGTPPTGAAVTAADSKSVPVARTATITLTKTAGTPTGNTAGSTIPYTFTVTNTGNTTLTSVTVSDSRVSGVACLATTLAPGVSTTCTAAYTVTQADVNAGKVDNTATVTGTPPAGMTPPTATATATSALTRSPAIALDKQSSGTTDTDGNGLDVGDILNYTFLVTNTGNVTLNPVSVSDTKTDSVTCPVTALAPGASTTCTGGRTLTQADLDAGHVYNTATASGVGPVGTWTPTATDSVDTPLAVGPAITLAKKAGTPSSSTAGATIPYTFTVTNSGNVTLNGIWLQDSRVYSVSCPVSTLAPGASTTCTAMYTVTQSDIDAGSIVNSATVNGYAAGSGQNVQATAGTTTVLTGSPAISLDKQAGTPTGSTVGSTISYSFIVTNSGNVGLNSVTLNDPRISVSCPGTSLAPGGSTTCTGTYTLTQADVDAGHVANTATAAGTSAAGKTVNASDSTDTPITRTTAITLKKQAGTPSGMTPGSTIPYSFLVTNTGNVTLTSVALSDPLVGSLSCPATTLAPGASMTCVATHAITQAELDAGVVTNTATVTGTPPSGLTKPTATDTVSTPLTRTPAITLKKQAGTPSGATAGSTIAYTFLVTNTGNVTLTSVGVADAKVGTVTCPATTLAPGASTTCTAGYTLTQADVDAGKLDNTATATGTPPAGLTKPTATDSTTTPIAATPKITLVKTAGAPSGNTAGATIPYTFLVTNTGNVTLTAVAVTDPLVATVSCPAATLAPGASTTCTGLHTITQSEVDAGTVVNHATASGTPPTGGAVTASGTTTTPLTRTPAIALDKQAGSPSGNTAGSTIGYTFLVTNTGNVTLTTVGVTDAVVGAVSCPATTLAPGASTTCTGTRTLTQADVDSGHVANTATATGTPPTGLTKPTAEDSTDTAIGATPSITLDKQAGTPSGTTAGSTIAYTFVVQNTGNVTLTSVKVTDALVGTVTCPVASLAPGASTTCTATYTLTQADVDSGHVANTATASGTPPTGNPVTAGDSTDTSITSAPSITLHKTAGTASGTAAGATIPYTFLVTNTGNVTLTSVKVTDAKVGAVSCPVTTLAPVASTTCTGTYTLTQADIDAGKVVNTATASGTPTTGNPVTATDSATKTLTQSPSVTVDKQAGTPSGNTAGSKIAYTFLVQNTGNVTLTSVGVSDPKVGAVTCPATSLAPGASTTCSGTYTLTQADVDSGHVANTATASGTPPTGSAVTGDDSTDTPITPGPAITLKKKAGTPSGNSLGSAIDYTFLVTNTGNVTLHSVGVSDPKVGAVSCPATTLVPGASTTCTATYTLTQADVDAGSVTNTATASGTPPTGGPVTGTDTITTPISSSPALTLVKSAGTPSGTTAGSTIAYSFAVTNTGNVTLTSVGVSDAKAGTVTCPVTTLAPGGSTTCSAIYTLTQADVDAGKVTNSATASGTPPTGSPVTATDSVTKTLTQAPSITVDKQAGAPSGNTAGSTIAYTFVVQNTGNVTLTSVGVSDPKVGTVSCPVETLAPGASTTCSGTHTLTQADVDSGHVANTATASGTPPSGGPVTGTDSTDTTIAAGPALTLVKSAGTPSGTTAGSTIGYSFLVTNTGNVTLTSVGVSDPKVGAVSCPATTLVPGGSTTCTATYTLTQADVDAGQVHNTATASGTPPTGSPVTATDSVTTKITGAPSVTLDKQAGTPSGETAGSTIAYTFVVQNTGNVTLHAVGITDVKVGTVTCPVASLAPGASTTCMATYTLTQADVDSGHVANSATASGTPPTGSAVTGGDSTDTPIAAGPALTLVKSAGTPSGHTAGSSIAYSFLVTNTGNVTLTSVKVTDAKVGAVSCPATTLAPGGSTTCSAIYALTQADVDAGQVQNTATASGTPPTGSPVTATDSVTKPLTQAPSIAVDKQAGAPSGNKVGSTIGYTFVVQNTGNVTLTSVGVSDPKVGTVTCPAGSLAPGASTTCTAMYTLTQADVDSGHVANTATASGTPPTGSPTTGTDTTDTPIPSAPALTLVKSAGTPSGHTAGSTIAYSFLVTNTGNVTLTSVGVSDPKAGAVSCPVTTLAPGGSTTCTARYTLTQVDVDAGKVINTATASGTPPTGNPVTATDTVTTPITPAPALTLDKQAGTPTGASAGSTIAYTFVVQNTGNVTLHAVGVTDAKVGAVTCPAVSLAPGASITCEATYVLTQADVDSGHVANTATASGTPPTGGPTTGTDTTDTPIAAGPALTLVKSAGTPSGNTAGSRIAYSFVVTNTGNVTLTSVGVSDAKVGAVSCPATTLAPGGSTTCSAIYTLTQADVDAGQVQNTATASGTPPTGNPVTGTDTVTTPIPAAPKVALDKQAGTPSGNTAGSTIAYTFVVQNTGNVTLHAIAISDPLVGNVTCPPDSLAPGASTTCSGTYTLTQADVDSGHVANTATASGTPPADSAVTGTDSTDTPITSGPALTLVKSAGTPSGNTAGSTIAYSFLVTNTGNVTLTSVGVSDPKVGAVSCPATTLAPGAQTTCTATYTLTQADVDAGKVTNSATASGTPPTGTPVTTGDTVTTPVTAAPSITLDKQAGTPSAFTAGGTIDYTFVVTNTGNVTLHALGITDAKVGTVTCPASSLAPGATTTCHAAYTLTQADVDTGEVANTATVSGTPPTGNRVTATDSTTSALPTTATLTIDKQAGNPSGLIVGSTIAYTFVVENTGNVTLTLLHVNDSLTGSVCPVTTLAPGVTTTCYATYTLTQGDVDSGHVANTALATATPPSGPPVVSPPDSTDTVIQPGPGISLDKQAGPPSGSTAGSTIHYSFVVTNTGNVTLDPVAVSDPLVGPVTCAAQPLAPGDSRTCEATYTLTQADVDAGRVDNLATASGTPPTGTPVTATDSTETTIESHPSIALDKQAGTPSGNTAESTIDYTFVVTNTGNVTLHSVGVTDAIAGAATCPATSLAPNASMSCTATYTISQADVDAGHVPNTASVSGTPQVGGPVTATDSTDSPIGSAPSLTLDKQAGSPSGNTVGSTIAYTFLVQNIGNVTLHSVTVSDPKVGTVTCPATSLAPGATVTCHATYTLTLADVDSGIVSNTATAAGTPPKGNPVTGNDTVTTPIASSPAITLDKQAGTPSGHTAGSTIDYTFTVTNTGNVTLRGVTVSDPKAGPVTCPATTLRPGESTTCTATYTLTQADVDNGHVPNTALASGAPPAGNPVTGTDTTDSPISSTPAITLDKQAGTPSSSTAGGTIAYTFVVTNTGNVTLHSLIVSDPLVGAVTCPEVTLAPQASTTCTAAYTLTQADVDNGSVSNTATATGTPPSGDPVTATDTVTSPIASAPGITMDKQAGTPSGNTVGSTIDYTFVVQNTGNVTLHAVAVSDPLVGTVSCPVTSLAPGTSTTCSARYTLTQADVDSGHVANTATASGTPPRGSTVTGGDSTDTPITSAPGLTLDKQAGTPTGTTAGSTIAYTFVVQNTGNVTLTSVGVSDSRVGAVTCPVTSLAPQASTTCQATYTLTQADVDAGVVTNTATVSGTTPAGSTLTATDSVTTQIPPSPAITLDKRAGTPSGNTAGSTIDYTFVVQNTGNVTLDGIVVTDPRVPGVICPATTLAPTASMTCSATYTLTQADVDASTVHNTAVVTATPPQGSTTMTASDSADVPIASAPGLTLDKRAGTLTGNTAGSTIAYTFVVTNTGNVTLSSVGVTDPKVGTVSCPVSALVPGASTICAATYTLTQADVDAGTVDNTAFAAATTPSGTGLTAGDSTSTPILPTPSMTLDKEAGTPTGNAAGATIAYTFVVTNTGNVTLRSVAVSDPLVGAVSCPVATLAPHASTTCAATYTLTQADIDAGAVHNSATASGTSPGGAPVTATDTADVTIPQAPSLTLDKQAGAPSGNAAGSTIGYTFVVKNTGNVTLTSVVISDPLVGAVTCPVTSLAPGVSTTCTATYTLTQADVDSGSVDNTATASGTPPTGLPATATDSTTTPIASKPSIVLDKQAGTPSGNTAGSTIAYTFVVQNTGNVTLSAISVSDAVVGSVSCPLTSLAPGASTTCSATHTLTQEDVDSGHVANTAEAAGTPPTGSPLTSSDSTDTPVTAAPVLTLDKQAGTPSGNTAGSTIAYTFVVANTGNVTLTSVALSDPLVGAVTCPETSLAPGTSTTCHATYTLTQADVDAGAVVNTATATANPPSGPHLSATDSTSSPIPAAPGMTLDKQAGTPSSNTAGGTIAYTFVLANIGNVTLTSVGVTDPLVGAVLCPVTTLAPGVSTICTATHTLTQADVDAGVVDNTASATGTPPSGTVPSVTDSTTTPIPPDPSITLDKQAGTPSEYLSGGTVDYTFVVQNTGNVTLHGIAITDRMGSGWKQLVSCPQTTLAPQQTTTCTATYMLTQFDIDNGHVANTASVSGLPPEGAAVQATDSTDTPILSSPAITLLKRAGGPSGNTEGSTIAYEFDVTNTGNVTLSSIRVSDPLVGPVECPVTALAPTATTTCTATYTLTQADVDAEHVVNVATVYGTAPYGAGDVSDDDSVSSPITPTPGIDLVKAGTVHGTAPGSKVDYTFTVTNTGNETLHAITVNDPLVDAVTCPVSTLAPNASTVCTATYTLTQSDVDAGVVHNAATVSGTPPHRAPVRDSSSVDIPVASGPHISVVKSAGTPSGKGAGSTLGYAFAVTNTGNVTLHGITVTDPLVGTVTCPETTLSAGATTTCTATYRLTQADVDAGTVVNSVTVSGTPPTGDPVTGTDTVTKPLPQLPAVSLVKTANATSGFRVGDQVGYTFVVKNTGNVTLTGIAINDPMLTGVTCPQKTLAPGQSMTCTAASYTVTAADVAHGSVTNEATASASFCPPRSSGSCATTTSSSGVTVTTRVTNGGNLAQTGTGAAPLLLMGGCIVAAGVLLLIVARRRKA
jgi:uncharacterized repeat protein (TIGR01451 family)